MDKLVGEGKAKEIIFVMLDAGNRLGGSWYLSSKTIGDYETYITKDLVSYIDNNYRTIAHRNSRGIAGFSMGGYGSMHLALKYPEMFSVVAAHAGSYDRDTSGWKIRLEYIAPHNPKDFEEFSLLGFSEQSGFALAAAISPNPAKPPLFLDKPFELVGGKVHELRDVHL
jgi:S-formylglutathione hydrolase FrmB